MSAHRTERLLNRLLKKARASGAPTSVASRLGGGAPRKPRFSWGGGLEQTPEETSAGSKNSPRRVLQEPLRGLTSTATGVAYALLWLPLVAVAAYSLNRARIGLDWEGFSLRWYASLAANPDIRHAALNTAVLAITSTAIATALGTALAMALARYPQPRWLASILDVWVDLPIVTPDIVFAAALVIAFSFARLFSDVFQPSLTTMILGHVTFQISFVALVVRSRLVVLGSTLSEAAHDLNATPAQVFRRVTLPLIAPAIGAGAVLAFTLSLDDFVISFFTAGPRSDTLPIYIYSSMRRGLSPEIHALSTLIVGITTLLVVGLHASDRGHR